MSKRKYTHIKAMEQQIVTMREVGMTRQEIADELGLTKEQIKGWIKRYNRRGRKFLQEREHKAKGRPRKDGNLPRQDIQKEFFESHKDLFPSNVKKALNAKGHNKVKEAYIHPENALKAQQLLKMAQQAKLNQMNEKDAQ